MACNDVHIYEVNNDGDSIFLKKKKYYEAFTGNPLSEAQENNLKDWQLPKIRQCRFISWRLIPNV